MQKNRSFQSLFTGISDYDKLATQPGSFAFGRSVDTRSDIRSISVLPRSAKESGSVVTDLPKWIKQSASPSDNKTYILGDTGKLYQRTSAGVYSLLRTIPNSSGNGLEYYGEDDSMYYTSDKLIGRYGALSDSPAFADDYLGTEGGTPLNTHSLRLVRSSSQYADRADSASLSITGSLTLETYIKPESLPATGEARALIAKWDESGTTRSYMLDIYGVSGTYGDGSDGALTISTNTTDSPIDSACTGTSAASTLSATNASFATGQQILIHQSRGTGAGTYQVNKIQSYTSGTITLETPLNATYTSGAQVLVLKQYTNVTVNTSITWTAKAWNGTVGGILAFLATGTVTVQGIITATGKGYLGTGISSVGQGIGYSGEGTAGASVQQTAANGNGGGGGGGATLSPGREGGGAGGGNANAGSNGGTGSGGGQVGGTGGTAAGNASLTTMVFGGAGGQGGTDGSQTAGGGGAGGGIIFISAVTLTVSGSITNAGVTGANAPEADGGGGGGGAGGSILLKAQTATLGSGLITAAAGSGGAGGVAGGGVGGAGSVGRIHLDYYTSFTGTTTPTLDSTLDSNLSANTTYQIRFHISSNGTLQETLSRLADIQEDVWQHVAVTWNSATQETIFYLNGSSVGSLTSTATAIHDNGSRFYLGAKRGSSAVDTFFDGKIDSTRVWSIVRTGSQINTFRDALILGDEVNLAASFAFNNDLTDETTNANNLTGQNSPLFTSDVAFSAATDRLDIDIEEAGGVANDYTLLTTIAEAAGDKLSFTPTKDPQKSIALTIDTVGTGNWTVTVHNKLNQVQASVTVPNAQLSTGEYEFIFDNVWRPVFGQEYHVHVTSTVADGIINVNTASSLATAKFTTYYQFLVDDDYHPIIEMINFLAIGNSRYVAKLEGGAVYDPHRLTLPPSWRVRALAKFRNYVAIGCTRGNSIGQHDKGMIFLWDGISNTYNYWTEVAEGGVNALLSSQGVLNIIAGYQNDLIEYQGGDVTRKTKRLPKTQKDTIHEVYPGAVCVWQSLVRLGVGSSTSTTFERGVYTYGSDSNSLGDYLTYDYPISTGSRLSTVEVGALGVVDNKMLIGWKDGTAYGMDVVDPGADPYPTATLERVVEDAGAMWLKKTPIAVKADFSSLESGQSVTLKYKLDRSSAWQTQTFNTADITEARFPIESEERYREVQVAIDLVTNGQPLSVYEFGIEQSLLTSEDTV